jgi:hypothetical protein
LFTAIADVLSGTGFDLVLAHSLLSSKLEMGFCMVEAVILPDILKNAI